MGRKVKGSRANWRAENAHVNINRVNSLPFYYIIGGTHGKYSKYEQGNTRTCKFMMM